MDFIADVDVDAEEARSVLEGDGLDVDAAFARASSFVSKKRTADRLRWVNAAREKAARFVSFDAIRDYSAMARPEMLALLRAAPLIEVSFRNFDELTDDDLRTLLADRDSLEMDEDK